MRQRIRACVLCLLATMVAAVPAIAQTTSGSIAGTVEDAQGAPIPGANVVLVSNERGNELTFTTGAYGTFTFPQLAPGTYTLKVTLEGFKTVERTNVVLNANDKLNAGVIKLEIGQRTETVLVTGRTTELKTQSAERGYALEGKALENVAVNSRSYLALVNLTPGWSARPT